MASSPRIVRRAIPPQTVTAFAQPSPGPGFPLATYQAAVVKVFLQERMMRVDTLRENPEGRTKGRCDPLGTRLDPRFPRFAGTPKLIPSLKQRTKRGQSQRFSQ